MLSVSARRRPICHTNATHTNRAPSTRELGSDLLLIPFLQIPKKILFRWSSRKQHHPACITPKSLGTNTAHTQPHTSSMQLHDQPCPKGGALPQAVAALWLFSAGWLILSWACCRTGMDGLSLPHFPAAHTEPHTCRSKHKQKQQMCHIPQRCMPSDTGPGAFKSWGLARLPKTEHGGDSQEASHCWNLVRTTHQHGILHPQTPGL